MRNAGLDEAQAGIKIAGRNINNLRYADDTTLLAESEEELKSLLMKVKEESEEAGLKLNIHLQPIKPTVLFFPIGAQCAVAANSSLLGSVCNLLPVQVALRDLGDNSS